MDTNIAPRISGIPMYPALIGVIAIWNKWPPMMPIHPRNIKNLGRRCIVFSFRLVNWQQTVLSSSGAVGWVCGTLTVFVGAGLNSKEKMSECETIAPIISDAPEKIVKETEKNPQFKKIKFFDMMRKYASLFCSLSLLALIALLAAQSSMQTRIHNAIWSLTPPTMPHSIKSLG